MLIRNTCRRLSGLSAFSVLLLPALAVAADGPLMVTVGEPGNPADGSGLGAVGYLYRIAVHETTNAEYVEFLNAVALADPNELYNPSMEDSDRGGILRSGSPGGYGYSLKASFANKPVNFVNWYDAARYCNWLHNGKPTGPQGPATTEKGAYDMTLGGDLIGRVGGALFFLPSHDEWYKAAYYDPVDPGADAGGTADYWLYPTRSDAVPIKALANAVGDVTNPGPTVANMDGGADWNGENGNVTTVGGAAAASPRGVLDMAGNANELTETPGTPIPDDPPLPTRRIRGGDFANVEVLASSPPGFSGSLNMLAEGANVGFRVAARYCEPPAGPTDLIVDRDGGDILLGWDDPGTDVGWNLYRELSPDPLGWGEPLAAKIADEDPVTDGVQYTDVGGTGAGELCYYLVTAVDFCGESPP